MNKNKYQILYQQHKNTKTNNYKTKSNMLQAQDIFI